MSETRWLTIIGLGEDGPKGLTSASLDALHEAEVVMGAERHLSLLPAIDAEQIVWPVPFADGLPVLDGLKGRQVAVLASGDPFWYGAGSLIARRYGAGEWHAIPGVSVFSIAVTRLGWPLESTTTLALHAAPFERLRPVLASGQRVIVTLRDGASPEGLANYLCAQGFGKTHLHVLECLGGPRERIRATTAEGFDLDRIAHPVTVAMDVRGDGVALSQATGQPDDLFETDGQITKQPVRALTLSALAPKPGERLWDIGAGSGSIGIEWLLAHPSTSAIGIEAREDRAERARRNAMALGQDRLQIVQGEAPAALDGLPLPDAVFVGGGLNQAWLDWLWNALNPGTRIVANGVTLDTQALLIEAQSKLGGKLMKVDLAEAAPLGRFQGWKAAYTLVQWSVVR